MGKSIAMLNYQRVCVPQSDVFGIKTKVPLKLHGGELKVHQGRLMFRCA